MGQVSVADVASCAAAFAFETGAGKGEQGDRI